MASDRILAVTKHITREGAKLGIDEVGTRIFGSAWMPVKNVVLTPVFGELQKRYPKLFLANGVTTIRTTGSVDPYQEMNIRASIATGQAVGPEIVVTGPYLQGAPNGALAMHPLASADEARRIVRYWAEEGVPWFKAYTTISRDQLGAAIDEAHKHGVKVTAHLCSVTYREAVALGIDHLEHGLFANTDYSSGKQPDRCPSSGTDTVFAMLDVNSPEVRTTIDEMVKHHVGLTSTLAVYELSSPSRVPVDQRVLDALYPDVSKYVSDYYTKGRTADDALWRRAMKKGMEFERAFVQAGGLLGAGADPCCISAVAGYADRLTGTEAYVQALEPLPALAGNCELVFDLPLGQASARGLISSVDPERRSFRVTLDRLEKNGFLLLAAALMEEGPETGPR